MPEIHIQLSLTRASGILAGIVAAMAKENLSLQSQKITRNASDRGALLDIDCEGEILDIEALTTCLENCLGVARLEFASSDGVVMIGNGERVKSIDDSSQFTATERDDEDGENSAQTAEVAGNTKETETEITAGAEPVTEESQSSDIPGEPAASQVSETSSSPGAARDPEGVENAAVASVELSAATTAESQATESTELARKPKRSGYRRRRRLR